MMPALIVALGLTFFPGQPHWYELDTAGVEWTVSTAICHVAKDSVCLTPEEESAAYDTKADYLRSGYQFGGDDGT